MSKVVKIPVFIVSHNQKYKVFIPSGEGRLQFPKRYRKEKKYTKKLLKQHLANNGIDKYKIFTTPLIIDEDIATIDLSAINLSNTDKESIEKQLKKFFDRPLHEIFPDKFDSPIDDKLLGAIEDVSVQSAELFYADLNDILSDYSELAVVVHKTEREYPVVYIYHSDNSLMGEWDPDIVSLIAAFLDEYGATFPNEWDKNNGLAIQYYDDRVRVDIASKWSDTHIKIYHKISSLMFTLMLTFVDDMDFYLRTDVSARGKIYVEMHASKSGIISEILEVMDLLVDDGIDIEKEIYSSNDVVLYFELKEDTNEQ